MEKDYDRAEDIGASPFTIPERGSGLERVGRVRCGNQAHHAIDAAHVQEKSLSEEIIHQLRILPTYQHRLAAELKQPGVDIETPGVSVRVSIQVRKHAELSKSLPGNRAGFPQESRHLGVIGDFL